MINMKDITRAVKSILEQNLQGYTIVRNAQRNMDPNIAAKNNGWIGVYRGKLDYSPHTIGGNNPYMAEIEVVIEVQTASMQSGADAEDRLQDAEEAVMDVLNDNKKLSGTVHQNNGYSIEYEFNADETIWHHAAIITARYEVRA